MPWYGLQSDTAPDAEERFYQVLESVVLQAMDSVTLSRAALQSMPVFLGSSSFEVGVSESRYAKALAAVDADPQANTFPIQISSIGHLVGHLRRRLNLSGADFTYGTACAASANAVLGACRMIQQGHADHALVIGVELKNLTTLAGFHSLQLIADSDLKPFDLHRSGMILGESCAAVILSASEASQDALSEHGSQTRITVAGGASLCDTSSVTSTNTDGKSIASVTRQALRDANLNPADISVIKAHGTASLANDLAEASGMHQVFSSLPPLFALKPYIGHTLGACGVTELILSADAMRQGYIPTTPGFAVADPELAVSPSSNAILPDSGFCLLNYFGFGGNNSVLVLGYDSSSQLSTGVV